MELRAALILVCITSFLASTKGIPSTSKDDVVEHGFRKSFVGDMRLTRSQLDYVLGMKGKNRRSVRRKRRNVASNLWPNAIIPYKIDCSLENLPSTISAIKEAMEEWQKKTCIRFVNHTNEKDYLTFFRDNSCWGDVGRLGGENKISVGHLCDFRYVVAHEIGHAIGFYHEQTRMDRDKYIDVKWDNILEHKKVEFRKKKDSISLGHPYDFSSIMHYSWDAFSTNGNATITPLKPVKQQPYAFVSEIDAIQTNLLYKCSKKKVRRKRAFGDCDDKLPSCGSWARYGYCLTSLHVRENCEHSCKAPQCLTNVKCIDEKEECEKWASWGHCKLSNTVMTLCTRSCHPKCKHARMLTTTPKPTPTTRAPTTPFRRKARRLGRCSDKVQGCRRWAEVGLCNQNPWYMKYCQRSCHPTCRKAWCIDRAKKCRTWKKNGYCRLSGAIMQLCSQSCNPLCKKGRIEKLVAVLKDRESLLKRKKLPPKKLKIKAKKVKCIDSTSKCKDWYEWGHCSISITVRKLCPKSCHPQCRKDKPKPLHVKMGIGILCKDRNKHCQDWAKHGHCERNPKWMRSNCKASCKQTDCDREPQKPSGPCSSPLGIGFDGKGWKIPDKSMTSNSELQIDSWSASASNARLYYEDDADKKRIAAWCAKTWKHKLGPYIEIDLGSQKKIKYIATQGRDKFFERVSKFKVRFSNDRRRWYEYIENGRIREFDGNCDHFTPILNTFSNVINARYFRYYPTKANYACVRMELYGC
ncbi:uncharacterized protein LOC135691056 isoform X2 [Rhopilema esculentum]